MDEEKDRVEVEIASDDSGTQEPTNQQDAPSSGEKDVQGEIATTGSEEDVKVTETEEPTKEDLDRKAEEGKMSSLEKRTNEAEEKARIYEQQQTAILENLSPIFQKNPELYEEWRKGIVAKGIQDPGSHQELYGGDTTPAEQAQIVNQSQAASQVQPQEMNQDVVKQAISQELTNRELEAEGKEGFKRFIEAVPEMNPTNLTEPNQVEAAKQTWNKVATIASSMKAVNPNMTSGDAFVAAYYALPENQDKVAEKARAMGELQGRANAYASGSAGTVGSTSSTPSSAQTQTVSMTKSQLDVYNKMKAKSPELAKKYAKNIADSK